MKGVLDWSETGDDQLVCNDDDDNERFAKQHD